MVAVPRSAGSRASLTAVWWPGTHRGGEHVPRDCTVFFGSTMFLDCFVLVGRAAFFGCAVPSAKIC